MVEAVPLGTTPAVAAAVIGTSGGWGAGDGGASSHPSGDVAEGGHTGQALIEARRSSSCAWWMSLGCSAAGSTLSTYHLIPVYLLGVKLRATKLRVVP